MRVFKIMGGFLIGIVIRSILICGIGKEQVQITEAPKPHIPHGVYFPASTSSLTYTVSFATANGDRINQLISQSSALIGV